MIGYLCFEENKGKDKYKNDKAVLFKVCSRVGPHIEWGWEEGGVGPHIEWGWEGWVGPHIEWGWEGRGVGPHIERGWEGGGVRLECHMFCNPY